MNIIIVNIACPNYCIQMLDAQLILDVQSNYINFDTFSKCSCHIPIEF